MKHIVDSFHFSDDVVIMVMITAPASDKEIVQYIVHLQYFKKFRRILIFHRRRFLFLNAIINTKQPQHQRQ